MHAQSRNIVQQFVLGVLLLCAVLSVGAAETDYQLLIVSCDPAQCQRVAEPRIVTRGNQKADFRRHNMKVEIETLHSQADEVDANVRIEIVNPGGSQTATSALRRTLFELPCRLTSKALTSLATFGADGAIYHVWAKIVPSTVAQTLR
jgi:hypothetical protein